MVTKFILNNSVIAEKNIDPGVIVIGRDIRLNHTKYYVSGICLDADEMILNTFLSES